MVGGLVRFGKYRGRSFDSLPTGYLKWLLASCDSLEHWEKTIVKAVLAKRGNRYVAGSLVVNEIEQGLLIRLTEDDDIPHGAAAAIGDHLLGVFEEVRKRHDLAEDFDLIITPRPQPFTEGKRW